MAGAKDDRSSGISGEVTMNQDTHLYRIRPSRLMGQVVLSGAKNSALRLLAASLLTDEDLKIQNFPDGLLDAHIQVEMLEQLGKHCLVEENRIEISEPSGIVSRLTWNKRSIRNTLLVLGALVARTGSGAVPLPGGCELGERRYDLHEMLLQRMGAEVWTEGGMLCAEVRGRLKGTDIHLPIRSTGATENAVICGSLAEGVTRVWNPHVRPEILDLIDFLRKMGARIKVFGQEHIEITGVDQLGEAHHVVVPDNMEAITWLIGSVITDGDVEIIGFPFQHLEVPLIYLRKSGARCFREDDRLIVRGGRCYPVDISTGPYPGINSDMQPLFAVYGLCANGESRITDLRFPGRFRYAEELKKMGGLCKNDGNMLAVAGGTQLLGARVTATDLRAGAALALAGLVAKGETVIEQAWQIDRGYNRCSETLMNLGADIQTE